MTLRRSEGQQPRPGRRGKVAADPGFFKRLEGQQAPEYLWIGCSDSRVPANEIVDLDPGELFVHRNVANLAPPQDANYLSVLQFAVDVIKVKHILVVGHYGCGGVAAAVDGQRRGLVDHWLHPIREVHHEHRHELDALPDEKARWDRLVRAERHPPGEERGLRRLRAGRLGARPAALRARLGLYAGHRPGDRPGRHRQRRRGPGRSWIEPATRLDVSPGGARLHAPPEETLQETLDEIQAPGRRRGRPPAGRRARGRARPGPPPPTPRPSSRSAESQLAAANEYAARASWVRANFITEDTQWLEAKANAEENALVTRLALEAARFNGVQADPVTARKLKLLKLVLASPPPDRPGAAAELADLLTKLELDLFDRQVHLQGQDAHPRRRRGHPARPAATRPS